MCIRDRHGDERLRFRTPRNRIARGYESAVQEMGHQLLGTCLLYTSDAADERSSVDLGGRRIIKKKKSKNALMSIAV